ncbi:hypothetical protein R3P38DRAFT_2794444 [Favolaschia claudopus]|uniref:Uncharacterized protein n=1 Tax=Favolaschia claudopus TaxID=2862362 RepID=A0AAW0AAR8_9AGAR
MTFSQPGQRDEHRKTSRSLKLQGPSKFEWAVQPATVPLEETSRRAIELLQVKVVKNVEVERILLPIASVTKRTEAAPPSRSRSGVFGKGLYAQMWHKNKTGYSNLKIIFDPTSFVAIRPQEGSKKNGLSSRDFDGLTAQIKNLEKTANVS